MATLPTRSFSAIVSNVAAGMQGRVSSFLNFALGSVFLAISEAFAGIVLWLQGLVLKVVLLTRLATSYGPDADSWIADFGIITRIGASAATGLVTFSRFSVGPTTVLIPVGAQVKTGDGTQVFQVYADTTNAAYSAAQNGYLLAAQVASVQVPVVSITPSTTNESGDPGANGNVAAGAISLLASSIPGIDQVVNAAGFTNGSDEESDEALKARFRLAIASLSQATDTAIQNAVAGLKSGMQCQILENVDLNGATDYGMVTVIVDDGSGAIPSALLSEAQTAVYGIRAAGIRVGVYAATITSAAVQFTLTTAPGYYRPTVVAQLQAAISANINGLGLGIGLPYFAIAAWALAVPGVAQIDNLTLNGVSADLAPNPLATIKTGSVVVN